MQLRRKRIKWPVVAAVVVVLAGAGTAYAVAGGTDTPTYRTVTATTGDVEQTLTLAGLVDAAKRADLAFGTDGTVAKVRVAEGDEVKAGQVIATLETDDLDASVTEAVATLAKARATLESDESSQSSSVSNAASNGSKPSGTGKPTTGNGNTGSSSAATAALLKKLKAEQDAVVAAQSAASAALSAAADALTAQTAACANAYQSSASDTPTDGSTPSNSSTASDQNAACDAALADVQDKQAAVKKAQDDLADALTALSGTLTSALGSVAQEQAQEQAAVREMAARTTAAAQTPSGGTTVTAARLASDQAQIDQAEADLITAKAARAAATLRSTRTGTVVSLDLKRGDAVTTGTAVAVVVGGKAVTLTGTVSETNVAKVKVGQQARVTVPGSSTSTVGTVTAIGMTADTSTGSTTYPVTITVEDPTIALPSGSRAQVAIVLATVKDVITLPISAITRNGTSATVRTWNGKSLQRTVVTLGAVGSRTVAISKGITAGTKVVVADVDQAISGASSELNNNRSGFNGPPGGGQFTFRNGAGGGGPTLSRAN